MNESTPRDVALPSYDRYTLEQLQRARRSINVERFPERTELLNRLIAERQQLQPDGSVAVPAPHIRTLAHSTLRGSPWLRRSIGVITIWGAASGALMLLLQLPASKGLLSFLLGLMLIASCSWLCWAGVLLMEDRPRAVHHNQMLWALQIPTLASPWFSYTVANAGIASIWVRLDEFAFGFKLYFGTQLDLKINTNSEPLVFGVNFVAIAVIGLLVALEDSAGALATPPDSTPLDD